MRPYQKRAAKEFALAKKSFNEANQILSTFLKTHMNTSRKTLGILLASGLAFLGIATAYAQYDRDYAGEIQLSLDASERARMEARNLFCEYIGELTNGCYKKDEESCGLLQAKETEYQQEFSNSAYVDCFSGTQSQEQADTEDSLTVGGQN